MQEIERAKGGVSVALCKMHHARDESSGMEKRVEKKLRQQYGIGNNA